MTLRIVVNCLIISAVFSLITPALFLVEYIPEENALVPQIDEIDLTVLREAPNMEGSTFSTESIKMRKISGFERITYIIDQPYFFINYLENSRSVFLLYLLATATISAWNIRAYKRNKRITSG
ncbi:MAG: hypothetical protein GY702_17015 [Desulfobulbaceae bacterium]|nr:hypothetical protein [Desulfobulbaceae bacterium]